MIVFILIIIVKPSNQYSPYALSLNKKDDIEEFQPIIELLSPSVFLNDILSSFFPSIPTSSSNNNPLVFHSLHHHTNDDISKSPFMLLDNTTDMTELLIIDQPSSFIESDFVFENQQPKKIHSLAESIEDLCLLIRKLLQYELTDQKITPLQATIANQLAILLTYLAIPNNDKFVYELMKKDTAERMTSTDETHFSLQQPLVSTIGTQTDVEFETHAPSSPQKVTSLTELISTSGKTNIEIFHSLFLFLFSYPKLTWSST